MTDLCSLCQEILRLEAPSEVRREIPSDGSVVVTLATGEVPIQYRFLAPQLARAVLEQMGEER